MKKKCLFSALMLFFSLFTLLSCGESSDLKNAPPTIFIKNVSDITYKSANVNVYVIKGSEEIKQVGIKLVKESKNDTVNMIKNVCVEENGFEIEGLNYSTKYTVYGYVQTSNGNIYKSSLSSFTTLNGELPNISRVTLTERSTNMVKLSSSVDSNPDFPIIEKGYYIATTPNMDNAIKCVVDDMNTEIKDLQPRKTYYAKAFAKNVIGEIVSSSLLFETKSLNGQWTYAFSTKARCMAIAVSDGESMYFGLGNGYEGAFYDWNKYNPKTNTFTSLKAFPGLVELSANDNNVFYIDNNIYVTCRDNSFWAYDINKDEWIQKQNTTGERIHHIAISAGEKGYYGLGEFYLTDLWEYTPKSDTWTKVTTSPFDWFSRSAVFSIDNNIYFCSAYPNHVNGLYKYNVNTKEWTKLKDFPGIAYQDLFGFSIGSRGYVVVGHYDINGSNVYSNELWEYTPLYDEWEKKADYPEKAMWVAGCTVGDKAYVGTGCRLNPLFREFYVFDPDK